MRALPRLLMPVTTIGYAAPGAVLAVGILFPLAALDHRLADLVLRYLKRELRADSEPAAQGMLDFGGTDTEAQEAMVRAGAGPRGTVLAETAAWFALACALG